MEYENDIHVPPRDRNLGAFSVRFNRKRRSLGVYFHKCDLFWSKFPKIEAIQCKFPKFFDQNDQFYL